MRLRANSQMPLKALISYSHRDKRYRELLSEHLAPLSRQGLISVWHDQDISAGNDWARSINAKLGEADVVILLLSCAFFASEFCWCKELQAALARHHEGSIRIVPVVCRPVDWEFMSIGKLQALPSNGKAIAEWKNRDQAFQDVARGIRKLLGAQIPPQLRQVTLRIVFEGDESDCEEWQEPDGMQELESKLAELSGDSSLHVVSVTHGSVVVEVTCDQSAYSLFSFAARNRLLKDKLGLTVVDAYTPNPDETPEVYTSPVGGLAAGYIEEMNGNGTVHCPLSRFHGIGLLADLCRSVLPEPTSVLEDCCVLITRRGRIIYAQSNLKIPGQEYSPKILTTNPNGLDILRGLIAPYGLFDERRIQRAHSNSVRYLVDEELKLLPVGKRFNFQGAKHIYLALQPEHDLG
jgi:hypothetical protein